MAPARESVLTFWKLFFRDVGDDDLLALAAAISYYTTLCLSPLLLLSLAVIGTLYPGAQERFLEEVGSLVGAQGELVIRSIVSSVAERPDLGRLAGWIGAGVLLFGASAVFAQLQLSLNRIWGMKSPVYKGALGWLRRRVMSAGMLLAVLFLTIVSFVMQAVIGLYLEHTDTAGAFGPAGAVVVWLLWAFYSALIFLFSAELLYALARHRHWR